MGTDGAGRRGWEEIGQGGWGWGEMGQGGWRWAEMGRGEEDTHDRRVELNRKLQSLKIKVL